MVAQAALGGGEGGEHRGAIFGAVDGAQQVHARLVVAVQLDVGAADQEVGQRQIGVVAQDPFQQADRLVDLAAALRDLGETRDRQRERRVLQRGLLEQTAGVIDAAGGLGEHAEPLLGRAEGRGDRARAFEGGRGVGDVTHLEQADAAQVRRVARQRIERLRARQRLDRRRGRLDTAQQQRRQVAARREPRGGEEAAARLRDLARLLLAQALLEQPFDLARAEHEVARIGERHGGVAFLAGSPGAETAGAGGP